MGHTEPVSGVAGDEGGYSVADDTRIGRQPGRSITHEGPHPAEVGSTQQSPCFHDG